MDHVYLKKCYCVTMAFKCKLNASQDPILVFSQEPKKNFFKSFLCVLNQMHV